MLRLVHTHQTIKIFLLRGGQAPPDFKYLHKSQSRSKHACSTLHFFFIQLITSEIVKRFYRESRLGFVLYLQPIECALLMTNKKYTLYKSDAPPIFYANKKRNKLVCVRLTLNLVPTLYTHFLASHAVLYFFTHLHFFHDIVNLAFDSLLLIPLKISQLL